MDLLVRMLNIRNFVQMYLGKHSNKIKTNWNQWQEYTYIHKHNNNKQEILHSQARRESFSIILGRRIRGCSQMMSSYFGGFWTIYTVNHTTIIFSCNSDLTTTFVCLYFRTSSKPSTAINFEVKTHRPKFCVGLNPMVNF